MKIERTEIVDPRLLPWDHPDVDVIGLFRFWGKHRREPRPGEEF